MPAVFAAAVDPVVSNVLQILESLMLLVSLLVMTSLLFQRACCCWGPAVVDIYPGVSPIVGVLSFVGVPAVARGLSFSPGVSTVVCIPSAADTLLWCGWLSKCFSIHAVVSVSAV
jgi:hypothetical protein